MNHASNRLHQFESARHLATQPRFIGLGSQMRMGKDTAADHLLKRLNETKILGPWFRGSFAKEVKKLFCETFNVSPEFIEEWKVKTEIPPGFAMPIRDGLTIIGNGFRDIQRDVWIKKLFENNSANLVISDTRYINEANQIQNRGGITILLYRPGFENNKPSASEQELMPFVRALKDKPSGFIENEDIPFDLWLVNDGTLENLHNRIDEVVMPYIMNFWKPKPQQIFVDPIESAEELHKI